MHQGPSQTPFPFHLAKEVPNNSPVMEVTDCKMLYCPKLESLQHFFLLVAALLSKWNELKIYGNLR